MIAVIGFPRGGTQYAAAVLEQLVGWNGEVKHEMLGAKGAVDHRLIYFIEGRLNMDNIDDLCYYGDDKFASEHVVAGSQVILGGPGVRNFRLHTTGSTRTPDIHAIEDRAWAASYIAAKWSHVIYIRRNPFHIISTWSQMNSPDPTARRRESPSEPLQFFSESGKKSID